jgi:cysteine synthase A
MSAIATSVLSLVGKTPLVLLNRIQSASGAEIILKLETQNPAGSVKDRIALAMLDEAERTGKLKAGDTIIEPSSGNTGIGLALVAAVRCYKLIIVAPDDISMERRVLLEHYGAEVVLTPARKLMQGAIDYAKKLVAENPNCFMPSQFENPANPDAHRETTALEILDGTNRQLAAFVAGVGTGGTITGVGEVLKRELPGIRIVAVEPARSASLSGTDKPKPHLIYGIGAGFIPPLLKRDVIDEIVQVEDMEALTMSRRLAREEGISAGPSGGAAVVAALKVAATLKAGERVLCLIPDGFGRYASAHADTDASSGFDFII